MAKRTLAKASYEDLQGELKRRERQIKSLYRKRDRLLEQISEIDSEIESVGGTGARTHGGATRRRQRNETNLADALVNTLKGKTMSVTELSEAVQADGYRTTSANFRTIVNQTLLKDKRFKRVSRGKYTVKGK